MNKVVLITGASAGIGKVVADKLLGEGYIVYAAARRVSKMEDLKEKGAHVLHMDVTDDASVFEGVNRVISEQGKIDVLFSNAGYGTYGNIEDVPIDEIKYQFDVNVFGNARILKAVLPHMRKAKAGRIIITSSVVGKMSAPMLGWYAATKHSLEAMADALRCEVKELGIDVVKINPGAIKTEFASIAFDKLDKIDMAPEYKELAKSYKRYMTALYDKSPNPEGTADIIVKAIKADKPKTFYVTTSDAKSMLMLKKFLPDRTADNLLLKTYKSGK